MGMPIHVPATNLDFLFSDIHVTFKIIYQDPKFPVCTSFLTKFFHLIFGALHLQHKIFHIVTYLEPSYKKCNCVYESLWVFLFGQYFTCITVIGLVNNQGQHNIRNKTGSTTTGASFSLQWPRSQTDGSLGFLPTPHTRLKQKEGKQTTWGPKFNSDLMYKLYGRLGQSRMLIYHIREAAQENQKKSNQKNVFSMVCTFWYFETIDLEK